ncbi:hypothetical protein BDU57DRAFT_512318 [Ampelomyces quisqualis]|uniref:Uncharacterized protein n=1 Tax=Ampelomyces quisqualis TaxID=50730 RepID=A0A6A5QVA5_AMPQU|nr:hypothetical protein BDU57DRAFT_512318 [Ampelomyces quisqualis]
MQAANRLQKTSPQSDCHAASTWPGLSIVCLSIIMPRLHSTWQPLRLIVFDLHPNHRPQYTHAVAMIMTRSTFAIIAIIGVMSMPHAIRSRLYRIP